jgi:hypothetical protein
MIAVHVVYYYIAQRTLSKLNTKPILYSEYYHIEYYYFNMNIISNLDDDQKETYP